MNLIKKVLGLVLVMGALITNANAQATASSTASATIVAPITITNTVPMVFGNLAVTSTSGTVILSAAGGRTATGGVTLPATSSGSPTAAAFTVGGEGAYTYTITLPSSVTLTKSGGGATMTVDQFTCSISTAVGGGQLTSGAQNFTVGATIGVASGQAAGAYTSLTPFNVTVNYN